MASKVYFCIDLKSFYASVECVERGLNPLATNLVVADASRTEKTICLAVSPSLKKYGIPGRARLFEVTQKVRELNALRQMNAPKCRFTGKSYDDNDLNNNAALAIDFIAAPPRMSHYITFSARIYDIYLKYISPEDMHVYSIDEVFMDVTPYLSYMKLTAEEFARTIVKDVFNTTGITATVGIGTNMYLAKVALDIVAKKAEPDENGARIAQLDEFSYRKKLWEHRPLTDFWRIGRGYSKKLEENGLFTMGDIARCSVGKRESRYNEELLYKLFGINAELLIDHAWGFEPCGISDVKSYRPENNSVSSGQVLHEPYTFEKGRIIVWEMADVMALNLFSKNLLTDQIVITIGYDIENLKHNTAYKGDITTDYYGRKVPRHAHGTANLGSHTSSGKQITDAAVNLYDKIVEKGLLIRRVTISANHIIDEKSFSKLKIPQQLDLFTDCKEMEIKKALEEKERHIQQALFEIKKKYGKNAVLKGINFEDGATTKSRNEQIGGHRA